MGMSIWNDDNIATLRKLWAEGLSASNIAVKLGGDFTKNAVIGKVHRLQLSKTTNRPSRPRSPKATRGAASRKSSISRPRRNVVKVAASRIDAMFETRFQGAPKDDFVLPETSHFGSDAIYGLREKECKWPIGDPRASDFRFCCATRADGSSYCAHHQLDGVNARSRAPRRDAAMSLAS